MPGAITRRTNSNQPSVNVHDAKLLDLASQNLTPMQIEEETGIPAVQAVQRVKQLLASRNVWTFIEQQQLLLEDIYNVKNRVVEIIARNDMDADLLRATTSLLQLLGDRLDRVKELVDEEEEKQTKRQAKIIGEFFMSVWEPVREKISNVKGVDIEAMDAMFYQSVEDTIADYSA